MMIIIATNTHIYYCEINSYKPAYKLEHFLVLIVLP
jgi:hypothetical protein